MTILFEKPLLIGVLGAISAAALAFLWLQTGRKPILYGLIAVLLLTVAGIVVARSVTTEREKVELVLRQAARAVERNDLPELLKLIHSHAQPIRSQAEAEFPRYEFAEVSIKSNLEITLDPPELPTEATATFHVTVAGSEREGLIKNWRTPRFVTLTFRKDGDAWRVFSYQHADAFEKFHDPAHR